MDTPTVPDLDTDVVEAASTPSTVTRPPRKRLTPDERERIIELRMQRVPVRTIAKDVETTTTTIQRVWHEYLVRRTAERKQDLDKQLSEVLSRHEQVAVDARRLYHRALKEGNLQQASAALGQERAALEALTKLGGLDTTKIELAGSIGIQVEKDTAAAIVGAFTRVLSKAQIGDEQKAEIRKSLTEELRKLGDAK